MTEQMNKILAGNFSHKRTILKMLRTMDLVVLFIHKSKEIVITHRYNFVAREIRSEPLNSLYTKPNI